MTAFLFTDMTPAMLAATTNGCGAKTGWMSYLPLPQGHARIHCDQHDVAYKRGATKRDRLIADQMLLEGMLEDMRSMRWWQRPGFWYKAWLYYVAVRIFCADMFHYNVTGEKRGWEFFRLHYDPTAPELPSSAARIMT